MSVGSMIEFVDDSHVVLDHVVLIPDIFIVPLIVWLWSYPRFRRATLADLPGARERCYVFSMLFAWGSMACLLLVWAVNGRSFGTLGLSSGTAFQCGAGLALALCYLAIMLVLRRSVLKSPEQLDNFRRHLTADGPLMPRTTRERRMFALLSLTAGICEEITYRGYVTWYFAIWIGELPAIFISCILFGLAHLYLGPSHVLRTMALGAVFSFLTVKAGSLWPAIIAHAATDLVAGDLGYRALTAPSCESPTANEPRTLE